MPTCSSSFDIHPFREGSASSSYVMADSCPLPLRFALSLARALKLLLLQLVQAHAAENHESHVPSLICICRLLGSRSLPFIGLHPKAH
ncbi:hypothetical protein QQF64_033384 [Cirrhinus molitorella]|uniref:Uncharacterized protein n=1 Tax=Cirrhinus molitorella TaxID=172907 RepID=A0ABR3MTS4_9TELE